MIKTFYNKYLLKYPKIFLSIIFTVLLFFGYQAKNLEVDVSAETLLLEDDKDLKFFRQISSRYPDSLDILVISFTPKDEMLSKNSLDAIEKISNEFKKLEKVDSLLTILDIPLLENGSKNIKEIVNDVITLRSKNVNLTKAKEELLTSPMYSQNLVSKDFKTTSIVVMLKRDEHYISLLKKRNDLRQIVSSKNATSKDKEELKIASEKFKEYRNLLRIKDKELIEHARSILQENENSGTLFLGGVNMIAVDVISFVKKDVVQFGLALFTLLALTLWVIFRQIRFVLLPLFICFLSIVTTTGLLGFFGWEVTVISSNFVALQLILTISIIIHIVVVYREFAYKFPKATQKQLVLMTMIKKLNPSFFAVFTTIIGFGSLIISDIRPVINLGFMMGSGIALSLIISFTVLPAILVLLPKKMVDLSFEKNFALTTFFAKIVDKKGKWIIAFSIIAIVLTFIGTSKIKVENSFIDYFKSTTDIYKGMKNIDQNLGGTTPLEIVIKFKTSEENMQEIHAKDDDFDDFESEFEESKNDAQYWFTPERMQIVMTAHNYFESLDHVGKVQSLATLLKIGKRLNNNKELDNFELALLYNKLPDYYKDMILLPYLNIKYNELRFIMRIIDSNKELERNKLLNQINDDLKNIIPVEFAEYRLTGAMLMYNNLLQSLYSSQILTIGFVVLVFLILFWPIFGSLRASIIAVIINVIPMGLVFAIMGFAGIPLDIMTITIAAISIGIGVDDAIHYIHRFKEELNKDSDYIAAMYRSHASIGCAMYYTTITTVLGFGTLVFSNFIPTLYFGLLTVLVMTLLFLSAIMLLPKLLILIKPFKINRDKNRC